MAPKKRFFIDNPPSASSTSDDDDDVNQYIQQPVDEEIGEEEDSSQEEDSSSEEEVQHSRNPPPSTPISNPKPVASAQSQPKPTAPNNSKPIKAQPQAQTQTTTGSRSGEKRVADDNNDNENTSKRSKKSKEIVSAAAVAGGSDDEENNDCMEEDVRLTGKKSKKNHGRVFSEEDELAILKGIADFLSETGKDPMTYSADFHDFMKNNKSFRSEASTGQIKRKVRGLKDKFNKASQSFTKSHDKKCFELFQKISGRSNGESDAGEQNGKVVTNKVQKKDVAVDHIGSSKVVTDKVQKKDVAVEHIASSSSSKTVETAVDNSYIVNEILRFSSDDMDLCASSAKNGLELIDESKRAEMEGDWRKFHIAVMEIFVKRAQFTKDVVSLILKELDKSTR